MPQAIDLIPIIETARGLGALKLILGAGTRVRHVAFGAGDFTLDVNMTWSRTEAELAFARAQVVTASRAAGIEAPFDTVWVDLADDEGLEMSARTALGFGFQGKMCIHPKQIGTVNRVFTPEEAEVAHAERVVAAFAEAEAVGSAAIQLDGKFIDYPIVYRAQRSYRFVGIGWLMHAGWDVVHHLYGNSIWPFMPTASFGCMIFDALIAVWYFAGAPSPFPAAAREVISADAS